MRTVLLSVLRFVIAVVQMAGLLAFFHQHEGWGNLTSMLAALLIAVWLPFVGAILGLIAAIKVWSWSWLLAVLVFLPGLILPVLALFGFAGAGAWSLWRWRNATRMPEGWSRTVPPGQGDVIEGEVIRSHTEEGR